MNDETSQKGQQAGSSRIFNTLNTATHQAVYTPKDTDSRNVQKHPCSDSPELGTQKFLIMPVGAFEQFAAQSYFKDFGMRETLIAFNHSLSHSL